MSQQDALTPPDFWAVLQEEFAFEIDVAAHDARLCPVILTQETNALLERTSWLPGAVARAYCNPPFQQMLPWVQKAYDEAQRKANAVVGLLGPLGRAAWFRFAADHAFEIRIIHPRIEFLPPPWHRGRWSRNRQDVVLCVFRKCPVNHHRGAHIWTWDLTGRISLGKPRGAVSEQTP